MSIAICTVLKRLIGILILVGLPLVGWGVMDLRDFISDPARLGYAVILILLQFFIVIKLPEVRSNHSKGGNTINQLPPGVRMNWRLNN